MYAKNPQIFTLYDFFQIQMMWGENTITMSHKMGKIINLQILLLLERGNFLPI